MPILVTVWSDQGPTFDGSAGDFVFTHGVAGPVSSDLAARAEWLGFRWRPYDPTESLTHWVTGPDGRWSPVWQRGQADHADRADTLPAGPAMSLPTLPDHSLWPAELPGEYRKLMKAYTAAGKRREW